MKASIAVSNTRDPLNGRFTYAYKVHSAIVRAGTEECVDMIVQRERGPYIRVRMDLEAAREVNRDLKHTVDRVAVRAPSGMYHAFLVVRVQFNPSNGNIVAEVMTGSDDENQAQLARDDLEAESPTTGVLYCIIPGRW